MWPTSSACLYRMNCCIIQACSKCVWHIEREIESTFHAWNVPAGISNGCKGSVWSSGRKWTLGGGEGESGSWIVSCCLLAFLSTSFSSAVLFSKKALPIRQVTHCHLSIFSLHLFLSFFKIQNPTSSINLFLPKSCAKNILTVVHSKNTRFSKILLWGINLNHFHTWTGYITLYTEPNGHTGFQSSAFWRSLKMCEVEVFSKFLELLLCTLTSINICWQSWNNKIGLYANLNIQMLLKCDIK